jgi:hypothetical protein
MKQDLNPATPNVCNNCVKPEKEPIDEITILIKCTSAIQKVIEEICINEGVSFSEYFLRLHEGRGAPSFKKLVADARNIAYSKEDVKLPEGFGEVEIPSDEPLVTQELADPPKKRGRPFKSH